MRFLVEKSVGQMTAAELLKAREAAQKKEARDARREEDAERKKAYTKELKKTRKYKEKRLKWQMDRSKKKDEERKKKEIEKQKKERERRFGPKLGSPEVISSKDADPTATRKGISNAVDVAGSLATVGLNALSQRMQQKKEQEKKEPEEPKKPTPPPGLPFKSSVTMGQRARKDPYLRRNLTTERGGSTTYKEEYEYVYSCWREEFLNELGDLRKKTKSRKKQDDIVDVMKGKNKITIHPNVSEDINYDRLFETWNGASIFAKATPPLKKRTTPLSDIFLSKQPGKGSAEKVQNVMKKLFLGDRSNFYPNYDLSGHKSDDGNVLMKNDDNKVPTNEAYDDNDETFRQHSRERFTAGSGNETRRKRTAAVLKAMAAMNPPKAKKKKKKKEQ